MITESEVEKAVDYLRDNATKAAQARADHLYMAEYRKVIKAQLMQQRTSDSISAQEVYAYAHEEYKAHLKILREAVKNDEYHRWMMAAAEAKISAWQTFSKNQRTLGTVV